MPMSSSTSTRSRQAKLAALAGNLAISLARQAKDPLVTKFDVLHDKLNTVKEKIGAKYGRKANLMSRQQSVTN